MIELREHQAAAVLETRKQASTSDRVMIVVPTGGGKTYIASDIAARATAKGNKVLCLMHRRQLVEQMVDRFKDYGLESGVIMSGIETSLGCLIQIGTIQTYARRLQLEPIETNKFFVDAAVVIIDEAHHALSKMYQQILRLYSKKKVIGITATPVLSSGIGMGEYFQSIVCPVTVQELVDQKHLVPAVYWGPASPDLAKVRTVAGDYDKKQLNGVMNQPKLIGDVVQSWLKIAGGKQTMVFGVRVDHSKALRDEFIKNGVACEHLDAHSDDEDRSDVLRRFRNGDIQVITNCALYTEGSDIPEIECIVLARPTKSLGFYLQMIGRGARPYRGKENFIVIDHSGNVERLGFYEDGIEWSLNGKDLGYKKKVERKKEKKLLTCEMCSAIFTGRRCPQCGYEVQHYNKLIETTDDELVQIGGKGKKLTMDEKRRWFGMFKYQRMFKGYARGWEAHKYREKTGVWPRGMDDVPPIEPDSEFKNWMKHLAIKFIKAKQKQEAVAA